MNAQFLFGARIPAMRAAVRTACTPTNTMVVRLSNVDEGISMTRYTTVSPPFPASRRPVFANFAAARGSARRQEKRKQRQGELNVWEDEGGSVKKSVVGEA
jgi:hypothetical protein